MKLYKKIVEYFNYPFVNPNDLYSVQLSYVDPMDTTLVDLYMANSEKTNYAQMCETTNKISMFGDELERNIGLDNLINLMNTYDQSIKSVIHWLYTNNVALNTFCGKNSNSMNKIMTIYQKISSYLKYSLIENKQNVEPKVVIEIKPEVKSEIINELKSEVMVEQSKLKVETRPEIINEPIITSYVVASKTETSYIKNMLLILFLMVVVGTMFYFFKYKKSYI
jgi:hypothetical protein